MKPSSLGTKTIKKISIGRPWPLGSSITATGVNFSVAAPNAIELELLLFSHEEQNNPTDVIPLRPEHRSGDYWHVEVEGLKEGCCYGYRALEINEPHRSNSKPNQILLDPCARAIGGWGVYKKGLNIQRSKNPKPFLKSIVCERDCFDFKAHPRPKHKWNKSIIYELHVGGFTSNDASIRSSEKRGTFLGLLEKLAYLKDIGINTIELLPVFAFDPDDAPKGLTNYWGYSPINWFSPHQKYVVGKDPLKARTQFRELVGKCHDQGLEVILDVVYNHTAEGNELGPTISWKGFGGSTYYYQDKKGEYMDVSGCGNSIAANRPIVRQLIIESMRCWANELGVDGFRFDLGIALSRGEGLAPLEKPPLFEEIESDPYLSDLKLISEPWDCGGLYKLADFPAKRVRTWNGHFRDDVRRFWKGDKNSAWALKNRLTGSPDIYKETKNSIEDSINFITSHDGFTLNDLVSFNSKHNLANGERNRDGENHNNSWNHGVEGPSTDHVLRVLRKRQQRNLLATLLLSPGIPMMLMGDEVSRSQGGNNNIWCQNSPLGWMTWDQEFCDTDLYAFVKILLKLRRQLPDFFSPSTPFRDKPITDEKDHQSLWIQWHGVKLKKPDWGTWSHTVCYSLNKGSKGAVMWMGFNAFSKKLIFELPKPSSKWVKFLDSKNQGCFNLPITQQPSNQSEIGLESRSLIVMLTEEYAARVNS